MTTTEKPMDKEDFAPSAGAFAHKKNITLGRARVIWATETLRHPAGWALPGGRITQSHAEAATVAMVMDALMAPKVAL